MFKDFTVDVNRAYLYRKRHWLSLRSCLRTGLSCTVTCAVYRTHCSLHRYRLTDRVLPEVLVYCFCSVIFVCTNFCINLSVDVCILLQTLILTESVTLLLLVCTVLGPCVCLAVFFRKQLILIFDW